MGSLGLGSEPHVVGRLGLGPRVGAGGVTSRGIFGRGLYPVELSPVGLSPRILVNLQGSFRPCSSGENLVVRFTDFITWPNI